MRKYRIMRVIGRTTPRYEIEKRVLGLFWRRIGVCYTIQEAHKYTSRLKYKELREEVI